MQRIDFNQFKVKNPNYREAFEELCYYLFCREFNLSEGVRSDFNETGLETKPILFKGKHYGFQAKFFEHKIDGDQIKQSIEKAISHFKSTLDVIYVYLNSPLGTRAKYTGEIEKIAKQGKISIKWVVPSNLKALLTRPSNLDLAQLYFGHGDEFGFIKSNRDPSIVTLLQSSVYLTLPFKGLSNGKNVRKRILKNLETVSLVLGHPASGKTIFIHRLLFELGGLNKRKAEEMRSVIETNQALPMLINLKDCIHDSIENIIRNRQKDYKVARGSLGFIYLFDGLDELSTEKADYILSYIFGLTKNDQTRKVIVSCRSGNQNRYLFKTYFPTAIEYEIDSLDHKYIDRYFSAKNDKKKLDKLGVLRNENGGLLKEIKDAFLITLLWDTIDNLDPGSSFIDLFHHKINLLLEDPRFKKNIEELNLLEPKKNAIIALSQDISFEFHRRFQYRFNQEEIQKIILEKFPSLTYKDTNAVFSYLCSNFFTPRSTESDNEESYIYQHRRYQEFFLAQKLKYEYEKNRRILRENLLSNVDFLESIFLRYLRQQYEKENNLPKLIELNLIDVYLGKHSGYGADDYYYNNSSSFIPSLALQEADVFERLLADENLRVREKVAIDPNNIVNFSRTGKNDFAKELLAEFERTIKNAQQKKREGNKEPIDALNEIIWDQWQSWLYIKLVIKREKIDGIFHNLIRGSYQHFSSDRQYSFEESGREKLLKSFLRVCLNDKRQQLIKLIDQFDEYEFLALLSTLSEVDCVSHFIKEKPLQKKIKKFLSSYFKEISEENVFLLFYKKFLNIELTEGEEKFAREQLSKIRQEEPVEWRLRKVNFKYALISYSLDENTFPSLLKDSEEHLPRYYNELSLFAALFHDFTDVLRANKKIAQTIRNYLSYVGTHEKFKGSYLKADMALLWSRIFIEAQENVDNLLVLKNLLINEENDIASWVFLRDLRVQNPQLFNKITNEQEVEKISQRLENWDDDFPSFVDRCFDVAILFSTLNKERAVFFISKGINEGILRHGWRKDSIVSYYLVEALDILWRNNWAPKQELNKYAEDLFDLALRVSEITDGKGTWRGPYNVLDLVAKYDVQLAEKLKEKLYQKKGRYNTSNSALTTVILAKVKQGNSLEEAEREMEKYMKNYAYDKKPQADYYEQKFLVYLAITKNDLYNSEEKKQGFVKAYEQVEEMKREGLSYFLSDIDFKEEKEYFKKLCKKYKRAYNILDQKKEKDYAGRAKSGEDSFIQELKKVSTKGKLGGLYGRLENYRNEIALKKKESWDLLVNKTYQVYGNILHLIELLKESNYPHTDFFTTNSKYFHFAVAAALRHTNTRDEMLRYLYKYSGHQGFLNIMRAYELNGDRPMCLRLFKEFFGFCDFLVN